MIERKTITIRMPDEDAPRHFHLHADKAERFAAKVRADGGKATVGEFTPSLETAGLLSRLGIEVR